MPTAGALQRGGPRCMGPRLPAWGLQERPSSCSPCPHSRPLPATEALAGAQVPSPARSERVASITNPLQLPKTWTPRPPAPSAAPATACASPPTPPSSACSAWSAAPRRRPSGLPSGRSCCPGACCCWRSTAQRAWWGSPLAWRRWAGARAGRWPAPHALPPVQSPLRASANLVYLWRRTASRRHTCSGSSTVL